MSVIAYTMSAPDGGCHFFEHATEAVFCSGCDSCIDPTYLPKSLEIARRSFEVSCTYDNRILVSDRFREICLKQHLQGAQFIPVNERRSLYLLRADRKVTFDWERRNTRFENLCAICGQYESVVGAYPCFLKEIDKPLLHGFYHSDIEFGSGRGKSPILIVGTETKKLIEGKRFKRTEFKEVIH